jgi:hypothetical protein
MNSLNTPKELLKTKGIDYDSLPVLRKTTKSEYIGRVVKKIALATFKMTIIGALAIFALRLLVMHCAFSTAPKTLTPLGRERRVETEQKIRAIAAEAGIAEAQKIHLCVMEDMGSPAAACGKSTIFTSPEYLIQPEDLPEELKFTRLDKQELTEEEWVIKFQEWVSQNVMISNKKKPAPESQLEIDAAIEHGKCFLKIFRDRDGFQKGFKGVVGHELGHCVNNHTFKGILADLAWDLLALPTLGISTLFHDKVLQPMHKKAEIEADLYSHSKFGSEGLVNFFQEYSNVGKILHSKYSGKYDENGSNKNDYHHPHLGERILYLRLIEMSNGIANTEKIAKKIKGMFS